MEFVKNACDVTHGVACVDRCVELEQDSNALCTRAECGSVQRSLALSIDE